MSEEIKEKPLVNRVAQSSIITLNLEDFMPKSIIRGFDLKDYLFRELILKEKDFRQALQEIDWEEKYSNCSLAIFCSNDAIIPLWAYMLVAAYATPHAKEIFQGTPEELAEQSVVRTVEAIDAEQFSGKRVVIKGCSDKEIAASAYLAITKKLQPVVQSLMYGEPCSTVPIFKRPRVVT